MSEIETRLRVSGMTCGKCVARVEKALRGVAGVSEVSVDLSGSARVRHADDIPVDALVDAAARAGYPASAS
ncbi:MAG: heavy-metal-associated domain-containing protein [Deltaproteobacteria bacterium]|nr:heavy-metal-associated domain-containing protein [Deltaproteobacteria bacterium]